jgi:uncharacterized membrane protein
LNYVLIVIGAFIGATSRDLSGALFGGLAGWLLPQLLSLRSELKALRQRVDALQGVAAPSTAPTPTPELDPVPGLVPEPTREPAPVPAIATVTAPTSPTLAARVIVPNSASIDTAIDTPQPTPLPTPKTPGLTDKLRGWLFGGNTIVKAGVGILFIGLAFLAKYASEQVQLPIELRLASVAGVAVLLLVLGWRLRERRPAYAQVLQGGAIAALYLTLFSAFRFFGVIGAGSAFGLMALVATLAAALAVLQNARSLAAIGALGGFATPLLLSTGEGNHVALFSYYALLNLGIAAVAWFRTWRELNLIGFVFTFGVGTAWGVLSYRSEQYLSAQLFLGLFFLIFVALLLLPARRVPEGQSATPLIADRWVNGSLLFGLPVLAFGLQYGLVNDTRFGVAISALLLAAFYVVLATALRKRPHLALAFEGTLAVATIFLTLVIPFALDTRATAGAWALEGAGLVWLGWRQARRLARAFGYALLLIAGGLLMYSIDQRAASTLINGILLSGLMFVAGALAAAYFVQRYAPKVSGQLGEIIAEPLLIAAALVAAAALSLHQVLGLAPPLLRLSALIVCLASVALLVTVLAHKLSWRHLGWTALAYAPLLLTASVMSADLQDQPFAQGGWWAWPLALAVQLFALKRLSPQWPALGVHMAHAAGALVLAVLGAAAGRGLLRSAGDVGSAWPWLGWLLVPALMLLALQQARWLTPWPMRDEPQAYRRSAAGMLSVGLLLWTLLANVHSNGAALPLPYLPFINPLDLGVALALFAVARWVLSASGRSVLTSAPVLGIAAIGVCGFVWLNAMLVRGFHHLAGVPFEFTVWTESLPVQTGLTLLWSSTALALMWFSAKRGQRAPWMVGAALLAVVVLKLLIVDLSASGTVTRIVSFIGAGVLMLVIGYVAPLPAKAAADKAADQTADPATDGATDAKA